MPFQVIMLQLRLFRPETIKKDCNILIIGKKFTGKTYLGFSLLKYIAGSETGIDLAMLMSPSMTTLQRAKEGWFANAMIFPGYTKEKVQKLVEVARNLTFEEKERHFLLFLDDCMYDKKIMKTKEMRDIHMNGRQINLTTINCAQYIMDMPPDLRTNIDYVFVLKETIRDNRMKLWKYFFGMFSKFSDFEKTMDHCTNNREALVLDNTAQSTEKADQLFWYKAPPELPPVRMGKSIHYALSESLAKSKVGPTPASSESLVGPDRRATGKNQPLENVTRLDANGVAVTAGDSAVENDVLKDMVHHGR